MDFMHQANLQWLREQLLLRNLRKGGMTDQLMEKVNGAENNVIAKDMVACAAAR